MIFIDQESCCLYFCVNEIIANFCVNQIFAKVNSDNSNKMNTVNAVEVYAAKFPHSLSLSTQLSFEISLLSFHFVSAL